MGTKQENEITVKIKCEINELCTILEKKGFKIDKKQINIETTITALGFHNIEINLFQDVLILVLPAFSWEDQRSGCRFCTLH